MPLITPSPAARSGVPAIMIEPSVLSIVASTRSASASVDMSWRSAGVTAPPCGCNTPQCGPSGSAPPPPPDAAPRQPQLHASNTGAGARAELVRSDAIDRCGGAGHRVDRGWRIAGTSRIAGAGIIDPEDLPAT